MSGESPDVTLYDVNGNALAVQNATAIPASTPALMIAGSDGTNSRYITVDTSGRQVVVGAAAANAAAAGNPNLVAGNVTTSAPTGYTAATVNYLSLDTSGNLRVTGVGGTFPVTQSTSPWVVSASGNFNNASVGVTAATPPADATYMGALVTTAAESNLTNNDMYPLNMTNTGQLRIDGAYPLATAVATAVDMHQIGGVVTTGVPGYTTATINALSLTTVGQLRIDSAYPTGTATASTPDATLIGGINSTSGLLAVSVKQTLVAPIATDQALVVAISPNALNTYSASATITTATSPTDIFTITGSATTIVRITSITISGTQATANNILVQLIKRSSANLTGTSAAVTAVPYDTGPATAATATVLSYTANPGTLGTVVGTVSAQRIYIPLSAAAAASVPFQWNFGGPQQRNEIVLRGIAQVLAINLGGVSVGTGSLLCTVEWTESTV